MLFTGASMLLKKNVPFKSHKYKPVHTTQHEYPKNQSVIRWRRLLDRFAFTYSTMRSALRRSDVIASKHAEFETTLETIIPLLHQFIIQINVQTVGRINSSRLFAYIFSADTIDDRGCGVFLSKVLSKSWLWECCKNYTYPNIRRKHFMW